MKHTEKSPHFFGVRHLSPQGAHQLLKFLDEIMPTAVLVEGLSDANPQIEHFTGKATKPPVAILAYTEELPVRTLLYPFAEYSPEYQAFVWSKKNNAHAEFIDLPSDVFINLEYSNKDRDKTDGTVKSGDGETIESKEEADLNKIEKGSDSESEAVYATTIKNKSVYEKWALMAGDDDHDTYWERNFEHNLNKDAYRLAVFEFGKSIRQLSHDNRFEEAKNLVREAYMRKRIQDTIKSGHKPEKVVVVTGAYHSTALGGDLPPMTDEEFSSLPRVKTKLTLMPYSYYRLSSRSGYGAGNTAPAYYGMMWECLREKDFEKLPSEYFSSMVSYLRESGTHRSVAEVIEAVRLSNTLAAMHGGSAPTLKDLRDAAVICLGYGELTVVAEAMAHVEVGTAIGSLPEGVSRTSIQDDFYRELKRLKLEKYKSPVAMDLELDLRENRRVKSEEAAFLDLNRSCFLHRLKALNISFQKYKPKSQDSATWAESWILKWTPEAEIELVESVLRGETVELAVAFAFKERLEKCEKIEEAALVIRQACECGMMESMEYAREVLQRLAVDTGAFNEAAFAAFQLSQVISYGDIRKFDSSKLVPLLEQLFLRSTLLMLDAANCDNTAAAGVAESINILNTIALEYYNIVDEELWIRKLTELSERDDKNPKLSGFACSILLERNLMDSEKLSQEVARRLSPGIDADLGAGWFEGLSMRNRYVLLARTSLWNQISEYVSQLDNEQFKRALVFLRRAFADFNTAEKRGICEKLGEVWGVDSEDASDLLSRELSEEEEQSISELNDFDFGDI
ncbi:DUF5682 family protein [Acetivibrio cellulolyticus]|uniref:DUF5682 family protein n=1 Tax=Acetivibrio cellulolyticus TaxID=35830 RepID=UPI0001E301A1|nr:DUF5682 family protein [Acetivibrio cellulolyticus]